MPAWIYGFFIFANMMMMFIDAVGQGSMGDTGNMTNALTLQVLETRTFMGVSIPLPNLAWLDAVWGMMSWGYFFFDFDAGKWLRLFVGGPIQGVLLWGFVTQVMPVVISGISAFLSFAINLGSAINPFRRLL
jgi:hypothetical protein